MLGLRTIADAATIRERLGPGRRVVVIGAGFIGLEIAATALALGGEVTVVEIAASARPRRFARRRRTSSSTRTERSARASASASASTRSRARTAWSPRSCSPTASGLPADVVIVGVGVLADDRLARAAGLACDDGIVVDAHLVASDPAVSAIGDCAQFPQHSVGRRLRLESVQNATDQAKCVARRLTGKPEPYAALPWFWSDQGDLKLQIAGLSHGVDRWTLRGDPRDRAFAAFGFRGGALAVVETVNRGAEHMAARRIIGGRLPITAEQAADPAFDLRKLALSAKG